MLAAESCTVLLLVPSIVAVKVCECELSDLPKIVFLPTSWIAPTSHFPWSGAPIMEILTLLVVLHLHTENTLLGFGIQHTMLAARGE